MTYLRIANDPRRDGRVYYELAPSHQPRPWHCSDRDAEWCTHHGSCSCSAGVRACALHGADSGHPFAEPVLKTPTWRQP